ncbi:DUF1501 domain-containing protein [Ningiella sp. W23]|uniref:DUF1501 domain-containing protein n=1 Tax=Ningiella sp. W23 TaxID=3023715 RepID=UPI003757E7DA
MTKEAKPYGMSRRSFLHKSAYLLGGASACVWLSTQPVSASVLSKTTTKGSPSSKKLVWVFLRGAMDSLHAVIPRNDPHLHSLRPHLLESVNTSALPLNKRFSLHPDLHHMHDLYKRKQMSAIIAVASGYRARSHFEAQDQMESGLNATDHDNGWLARALRQHQSSGVALARSVPIAMRGSNSQVETWYPSAFPEASDDLLSQLSDLYQSDASLGSTLTKVITQKSAPSMQMKETRRPNFTYLTQRCGELLSNDNASCAMLELNGWDTHNNQSGRLSRLFQQLDDGLANLQSSLGEKWKDTLIIVSTEFGRTVAANGTLGTDHGTASNMFVLGGALSGSKGLLKGGKVLGKWPGLAPDQLYQGRDLMPTSDVRHWIAGGLSSHWGLSAAQIRGVFPDLYA